MARIEGIEEHKAGVIDRYLMNAIKRRAGKLAETWPIVARVPAVLRAWAMKEYFLDKTRLLDARIKRLASLKTSLLVGCPS
jgi:hypothetical protein